MNVDDLQARVTLTGGHASVAFPQLHRRLGLISQAETMRALALALPPGTLHDGSPVVLTRTVLTTPSRVPEVLAAALRLVRVAQRHPRNDGRELIQDLRSQRVMPWRLLAYLAAGFTSDQAWEQERRDPPPLMTLDALAALIDLDDRH